MALRGKVWCMFKKEVLEHTEQRGSTSPPDPEWFGDRNQPDHLVLKVEQFRVLAK